MENTFTHKREVNFGPRYDNGDTSIHTVALVISTATHVRGKFSKIKDMNTCLLLPPIEI